MLSAGTDPSAFGAGLPDDAGITLVEMLVAMVISVVVGSMMVLYLLSAVASVRRTDGQNLQAASARTVIDSWTTLVPLAVDPEGGSASDAVRFYSIAPQSVKFCVALGTKVSSPLVTDPAPRAVELALVSGQLIERRWTTCAGMVAGGTSVQRILAPYASVASPGAWLLTPLTVADLQSTPRTFSLISGQTPLNAEVQADSDKIETISTMQLSFMTLPAPGRPAPPATYSMLLQLSTGG